MNADQIANLAYLGLLAAAVGGWFIVQNRGNMGRMAQLAAIWGLIFLGVIAAYGLWSDIRQDIAPQQSVISDSRIEIPRGRDGHYMLTLKVNGTPVDFVVDTGASDVVLSQRDAERVGLDPEGLSYLGTAQTANGTVRTAAVMLDSVTLGKIEDQNLRAVVNEGELDGSLLGMAYLNLYQRIEIEDGMMVLIR
jgi:aspartyl protease family protein